MSNRRRFLHVIGATFVSAGAGVAGFGCDDSSSEPGPSGEGGQAGQAGQGGSSGNQGSASGQGGAGGEAGASGGAGEAGAGGEAGQGGSGGGGGTPPGVAAGPPADFMTPGLHKVVGKQILIGSDAGGLYALTAICTHESCDMSGKDGKVTKSGVQCTCHGSVFTPDGAAVVGPATGTLKAYALTLGDDGLLYVDTTTKVPNTDRLKV